VPTTSHAPYCYPFLAIRVHPFDVPFSRYYEQMKVLFPVSSAPRVIAPGRRRASPTAIISDPQVLNTHGLDLLVYVEWSDSFRHEKSGAVELGKSTIVTLRFLPPSPQLFLGLGRLCRSSDATPFDFFRLSTETSSRANSAGSPVIPRKSRTSITYLITF